MDTQPELKVWAGNLRVVTLFFGLSTCWRYGGMGRLIGLDWPQVLAMLRLRGDAMRHWKRILHGLQAMEAAVIDSVREREDR